ncbi:MAG: MBL fold metallo-hydrolase [Myxococcota bacterium]
MKRLRKILLVVVGLLLLGYATLLRGAPVPSDCSFHLDAKELRAKAAEKPGALPTELRVEHVASIEFPEAIVVTGGAFKMSSMDMYAYQLVYPDHTVVLDTALTAEQGKEMLAGGYHADAWTRVEAGMRAASEIYVTHEHGDHLGGLASILSSTSAIAHARLTKEQLEHPERLYPVKLPEAAKAALHGIEYKDLYAAGPGLVLVKAPGHTPGSQFFFIRLENGKELLLMGDTAWHVENIDEVAGPPRLLSWTMLHNDREANACQLLAAKEFGKAEPTIGIMPGHDARRMDALIAGGYLSRTFR